MYLNLSSDITLWVIHYSWASYLMSVVTLISVMKWLAAWPAWPSGSWRVYSAVRRASKSPCPFLLAQLAKRASQQHRPCMGRAVRRAVRLGEWLITARFRISMCGKTKPSIIEQASTGRVHMSPFKSPSAPPLHFCVHHSHELVRRRGRISSCPTESKRCFSHYKPLSPVGLLNQA